MNRIADPIILDPPSRDSSPRDVPDSLNNIPAENSGVPRLRRGLFSDEGRRRRSNHHGFLGAGGMCESPNQGFGVHSTGTTTTDSAGKGITATIGAYTAGLSTDPTDSAGGDLEQRL